MKDRLFIELDLVYDNWYESGQSVNVYIVFVNKTLIYKNTNSSEVNKNSYRKELGNLRNREIHSSSADIKSTDSRI